MSFLQGETDCHVQQMVRMPKGDNKASYKVTWRPRQSSHSFRMYLQQCQLLYLQIALWTYVHPHKDHMHDNTRMRDMHMHTVKLYRHHTQLISMTGLFLGKITGLVVFWFFSPKWWIFCWSKSPSQRKEEQGLAGMLCEEHLRGRWWECKNETGGRAIK